MRLKEAPRDCLCLRVFVVGVASNPPRRHEDAKNPTSKNEKGGEQ